MITHIKHILNPQKQILSSIDILKDILLDLIISSSLLYVISNILLDSLQLSYQINYAQAFLVCLISRVLFYNWTSMVIEKHLFEHKILYIHELNKKAIQDKLMLSIFQPQENIDDKSQN